MINLFNKAIKVKQLILKEIITHFKTYLETSKTKYQTKQILTIKLLILTNQKNLRIIYLFIPAQMKVR